MEGDLHCQRCGVALTDQCVGEPCANCLRTLALKLPREEGSLPACVSAGRTLSAAAEAPRIRSSGNPKPANELARGRVEVPLHPTAARFTTTLWTEVLAAPRDEKALASLCRKYWYPLYAFLRRSGVSSHEAEDLTQGFFVHLLSKHGLESVRRECGRFRSFLLASLQHFVADQRDRALAAKRNPGQPLFELDAQNAEDRYRLEPVERLNPETIFERRWALVILEEALAALESEWRTSNRGEAFRELRPFLSGEDSVPAYGEVAVRLAISKGAARVAVHRMRERYRELVRQEIGVTLATGEDLESEVRHLFAALRNT